MTQKELHTCLQEAAKVIGNTWPLYSFVTSNPLTKLEQKPFEEAIQHVAHHLGAQVLPNADFLKEAWETKQIDANILNRMLEEHGCYAAPEQYLLKIKEASSTSSKPNEQHEVDRIMTKWLAAFMDEGLAEWTMPFKEKGFYTAWKTLAPYDEECSFEKGYVFPKTSAEALMSMLENTSEDEATAIMTYHLAALPGWVGYIHHRTTYQTAWQEAYPISLEDYLAVRLLIAKQLKGNIVPQEDKGFEIPEAMKLQLIWLQAWEQTLQKKWVKTLQENQQLNNNTKTTNKSLDAQLVFCIDTRSALIRRHIEATGNYETFGYAGFFGIAMDYQELGDTVARKSCPPIVNSAYVTTEKGHDHKLEALETYQKKKAILKFVDYFFKRMKNMLPSTFGYVEGSGWFYGISLVARTIFPRVGYKIHHNPKAGFEHVCEPNLQHAHSSSSAVALDEKVAIVKSAFDLMGWREFAPIVVFTGHGSHTANNPFGSSLDCGACAASPGRHNARMLATLANMPEVRATLAKEFNIHIPELTVFIGAEHNTTTDEIVFFDADVPVTHYTALEALKRDIAIAQQTAANERLQVTQGGAALAQKNAYNWGETRPEWGLAKNAGLIVGPRSLTKNTNLEGRFFLHSYDWSLDTEGKALEGIMQGPMVVTQWINNHYYFATVDNDTFGAGTKVTHNVTGRFGVVQGNGGDLKMGLPLQSIKATDDQMYHQPVRLSVIIQAPLQRVKTILERNEHLQTLLNHQWIYLLVMDPTQDQKVFTYQSMADWEEVISRNNSKTKKSKIYQESPVEELSY